MFSKKSQASMEFLVLFGLMVLMFSGFMYFTHGMFERIELTQTEIDADALANDFMRYVVFSLRTDYLKVKNFRLPVDIGGRDYTVLLKPDILESYVMINLTDTGRTFYYPLKKKVNGTVDKTANLEHCIVSKDGKAEINPSTIELKPAKIDDGSGWREFDDSDYEDGILKIEENSDFSMYLRGNCMHDFKRLEVNVIVSSKINFIEAKESVSHQVISSDTDAQIYGDDFFDSEAYAHLIYDESGDTITVEINHSNPEIGPVGSDSLVELVFKAGSSSSDEVMQTVPIAFEDGLFREEIPFGDIIEIEIFS